jgi:hypothetical protein
LELELHKILVFEEPKMKSLGNLKNLEAGTGGSV